MSFEKISAVQATDSEFAQKTNSIPAGYEHLFDIGNRVEKNKNKEIDALLVEILAESRELQSGRRLSYLGTRRLEQDDQAVLSAEKASTMVKTLSLVISTGSAVLSVGAAFAGAGVTGSICNAIAQSASAGADHQRRITDAAVSALDHSYQRKGMTLNDLYTQSQSADSDWKKDADAIDRIAQNQQRLAEMVAS